MDANHAAEPEQLRPAGSGTVRRTPSARAGVSASGEKTINQYKLLTLAGRGTYCKVKWADDDHGRRCAIKVFSKTVLQRQHVSHFGPLGASTRPLQGRIDEELFILGALQHDHVLRLIEVIDDPGVENMYVVLEGLAGGQLMSWSQRMAAYSLVADTSVANAAVEDDEDWGSSDAEAPGAVAQAAAPCVATVYGEGAARHLFRQLISAVAYLHSRSVIHKDIKPDNIFLSEPPTAAGAMRELDLTAWPNVVAVGDTSSPDASLAAAGASCRGLVAKLGDFNSAVQCADPDCLIYDAEGTQLFTPPECFDRRDGGIPGRPRDVWSLGCVLFVMLYGRCPFWAQENIFLQLAILQGSMVTPAGIISAPAEALVQELLARDPRQRPSAKAAQEHSWLLVASLAVTPGGAVAGG
eukprot:TRINITY_DN64682_c0_g1_i1.p1 TRINITY_DN64682_c0_g1~~TRINITY_DN64682_c0_g1_i1.p1  ORF type:complete len:427 (+),score=94.81 TRINITY_DN64682_c0_g1_i1:54-1283(+)